MPFSKFPKFSSNNVAVGAPILPSGYGGVILTAAGSFFVNQYLARQVMKAREEHGVEYPIVYSPDNMRFNCIQRAHLNFVENHSFFLMFLFIGGLHSPRLATVGGVIYLAGRIAYAKGYSTGQPEKRMRGVFGYVGLLGLLGATINFGLRHLCSAKGGFRNC